MGNNGNGYLTVDTLQTRTFTVRNSLLSVPLLLSSINFNLAWVSNYIHYKVC